MNGSRIVSFIVSLMIYFLFNYEKNAIKTFCSIVDVFFCFCFFNLLPQKSLVFLAPNARNPLLSCISLIIMTNLTLGVHTQQKLS